MDIEEWIRDDADLVVNAKIIIHLGSLIPSNLIASHITFVIVLDNLLPPNTGSGFNLFRKTYHPAVSGHDVFASEDAAVTRAAEASLEGCCVSPPGSTLDAGGVTLLGP